ncbi:Protein of unknown function [Gryllus bimaculatus]|nr:Protein of unknown function [Gryllus bimaculatus]
MEKTTQDRCSQVDNVSWSISTGSTPAHSGERVELVNVAGLDLLKTATPEMRDARGWRGGAVGAEDIAAENVLPKFDLPPPRELLPTAAMNELTAKYKMQDVPPDAEYPVVCEEGRCSFCPFTFDSSQLEVVGLLHPWASTSCSKIGSTSKMIIRVVVIEKLHSSFISKKTV